MAMTRKFTALVLMVCVAPILVLLTSCSGDSGTEPGPGDEVGLPTVTTDQVLGTITPTGVWAGGVVTDDGGASVSDRGLCWSTGVFPTITDSKVSSGLGLGHFASWALGMMPATSYHLRAYATNSKGTAYGDTVGFHTLSGLELVTDVDGNIYHTVTIGNQVWMVENLKVTHFKDGIAIANVLQDDWFDYPFAAYCNYLDNSVWSDSYGRLYNWAAVVDPKGLAPDGWRVANENDWQVLEMTMGMLSADADLLGWRGTDEGGKLKEAGIAHWITPNTGATNEVGFTALPGGMRGAGGHETSIQLGGWYWTSTIVTGYETDAWMRQFANNHSDILRHHFPKGAGMSVRCIKW